MAVNGIEAYVNLSIRGTEQVASGVSALTGRLTGEWTRANRTLEGRADAAAKAYAKKQLDVQLRAIDAAKEADLRAAAIVKSRRIADARELAAETLRQAKAGGNATAIASAKRSGKVWIDLETEEARKEYRIRERLHQSAADAARKANQGVYESRQKIERSLITNGARLSQFISQIYIAKAAMQGLAAAATQAFAAGVRYEYNAATLGALMGSAKQAQELISTARTESLRLALDSENVVQAAKVMLASQAPVEHIQKDMINLSKIAAVTGTDVQGLATIYTEVFNKNRLYREDTLQMARRSVPLMKVLEEQLGVSRAQLNALVRDGKVGFAEFRQAMEMMATSTQYFGGVVETTSDTALGRFARMKSGLVLLYEDLGTLFAQDFVSALPLEGSLGWIESFHAAMEDRRRQEVEYKETVQQTNKALRDSANAETAVAAAKATRDDIKAGRLTAGQAAKGQPQALADAEAELAVAEATAKQLEANAEAKVRAEARQKVLQSPEGWGQYMSDRIVSVGAPAEMAREWAIWLALGDAAHEKYLSNKRVREGKDLDERSDAITKRADAAEAEAVKGIQARKDAAKEAMAVETAEREKMRNLRQTDEEAWRKAMESSDPLAYLKHSMTDFDKRVTETWQSFADKASKDPLKQGVNMLGDMLLAEADRTSVRMKELQLTATSSWGNQEFQALMKRLFPDRTFKDATDLNGAIQDFTTNIDEMEQSLQDSITTARGFDPQIESMRKVWAGDQARLDTYYKKKEETEKKVYELNSASKLTDMQEQMHAARMGYSAEEYKMVQLIGETATLQFRQVSQETSLVTRTLSELQDARKRLAEYRTPTEDLRARATAFQKAIAENGGTQAEMDAERKKAAAMMADSFKVDTRMFGGAEQAANEMSQRALAARDALNAQERANKYLESLNTTNQKIAEGIEKAIGLG